jgi:hypothetical protein
VPGRRLSHDEQRLLEFWDNPPANFPRPLLRQLRVDGGPGLRGIQRLVVPLVYPLTAICGRNGVGKSTVLALAALSARSPVDWPVYWSNARPRTRPNVRGHYTFSDFFHRRRGEPAPEGLRLGWVSMVAGNEVELVQVCQGGRWARVTDVGRHHPGATGLPVREIDFIPMSRVLSAVEYGVMRSAFARAAAGTSDALDADSLESLSYIMGRGYEQAQTTYIRGLGLASCQSGATYSGFDMGGGESSVIVLLSRLQATRTGALLLIEELELGLHAEAQVRLVEVLLRYCRDKRVQIICTTHSEAILDALPRQARLLIRRAGAEHEAVGNVSTRFAIHEMAGRAQPELIVYTEDRFAAVVVEEALAGPQRSRIEIRDVGSNVTLARQAVSHLRLSAELRAFSAFDGDCTEAQINSWIRNERGERHFEPDWLILPADGLSPERWILRELAGADYATELGRQLNCSPATAVAHIEAMRVQLDHHDSGYVLGQRAGLEPETARRALIRSVARTHPGLEPLRIRVAQLLDP